ncbi:hypothetical protein JCM10450v2_005100 [Rhodotorula kratochvilovae]
MPHHSFNPESKEALVRALQPLRRHLDDQWYEAMLHSKWLEDEWMRATPAQREVFAESCQEYAQEAAMVGSMHRPTVSIMTTALTESKPIEWSAYQPDANVWNDLHPLTEPQRRSNPLSRPVLNEPTHN